ncbi:MAG: TetR/AcrR family transcriptional regulator [Thermoleophilia bacterium]|nr:TetR/AcrR family transcriptional regulator [Thermoleophilia bacterium]
MERRVRTYIRKSGEERRREILEATLRIITENGLEGATISRIAAAVGMTPGALYRHFPSRAALITEANQSANVRAMDWIASSSHPDILRRLEELVDNHAAWAKENFNTVIRPFFLELASSSTEIDRLSIENFGSFQAIVQMVDEGKARGCIRKNVPSEEVAWALHMFCWAEDLAMMSGATEVVDTGLLRQCIKRYLGTLRADSSEVQED